MSILSKHDFGRQFNAFQTATEAMALKALLGDPNTDGAASQTTTSAVEYGSDVLGRKTVITCTAASISVSDGAPGQYGGVKIYDFPTGLISIEGATVSGNLTGYASLIDTFDGDVALGTTLVDASTFDTGDALVMGSNAISQAVAEVAAVAAASTGAVGPLNGTSTAKDCYLNFLIDDNAAHGAGTATFTGTVTIWWKNLSATD